MRKIDKWFIWDITIGIIAIMFTILIGLLFSCQPSADPLKNAEFPCICIYKSKTDFSIKFKCPDREQPYYFVDEKYHRKYEVGEIINEPLNK